MVSPDTCPGVGLLVHMVVLFLIFKGTSILFPIVAAPIYFPTDRVGGLLFYTSSPFVDFLMMVILTDKRFFLKSES